jgi:hypothetical protein
MLIVLDDESMARIKQHDPFEVQWILLPVAYSSHRPGTIGVVWASNQEQAVITTMLHQGRDREAMEYATRGFKYRPELGDHDRGPEKIK